MAASVPHVHAASRVGACPPPCVLPLTDLYDVGQLLGQGAFGKVHGGTDRKCVGVLLLRMRHRGGGGLFFSPQLLPRRRTGLRVALKFLSYSAGRHLATRAQLLEEIRILHHLNSSPVHHAPRLLAWFDLPGAPATAQHFKVEPSIVFVTELAEGGELLKAMRDTGALCEATARRVLIAVCEELRVLHAAGVVHRDIKLDNILILEPAAAAAGGVKPPPSPTATYLLADLGLAWDTTGRDSREGLAVGTEGWRAAEVLGYHHRATPASDIWAAGALLFTMLAGQYPFTDARGKVDERAVSSRASPRWECLSAREGAVALRRLLERMLAFDPRDRPSAEEVLAHEWVRSSTRGTGGAPPVKLPGAFSAAAHKPLMLKKDSALPRPESFVRTVIPSEKLEALHAHFDAPRRVSGGASFTISKATLREALTGVLGLEPALVTELLDHEELYDVLDVDHSGRIDWRELVVLLPLLSSGAPPCLSKLPRDTLRLFFLAFDSDGDGRLDRADVLRLLHVMHATIPATHARAGDVLFQIVNGLQFEDPTGEMRVRECVELETFLSAVVGGGLVLESALVEGAGAL